jgi:hypothetical protein
MSFRFVQVNKECDGSGEAQRKEVGAEVGLVCSTVGKETL